MPASYREAAEHQYAFILHESMLRESVRVIADNVTHEERYASDGTEKLTIEAKLRGNRSISTNDLQDIIDGTNTKTSRIKTLIVTTHYATDPSVRLAFGDTKHGPTVAYSVAGSSRATCSFIATNLADIAIRAKPWYLRIAFTDVVGIAINTLFAISLISSVFSIFQAFTQDSAQTARVDSLATFTTITVAISFIIVGSLLILALGYLADKLRAWLFPVAIFAFGEELERVERLKWWRGVIGISFLLALAVNVISSLL